MASFFNLSLDTVPPQSVSLSINSGALYSNTEQVTLTIGTTDTPTTGYQMKMWGDIEGLPTESNAQWETYVSSKGITLAPGDGMKNISLRVRDSVWNESAAASASIRLDTAVPVVTVLGPDVSVISKITGKNEAVITFTVDEDFVEYAVKVVPETSSQHSAGTQIPTDGGSSNTSGTGDFFAETPITCTINGTDLATAAGADGEHIVKVFVKDSAGNWSNT